MYVALVNQNMKAKTVVCERAGHFTALDAGMIEQGCFTGIRRWSNRAGYVSPEETDSFPIFANHSGSDLTFLDEEQGHESIWQLYRSDFCYNNIV